MERGMRKFEATVESVLYLTLPKGLSEEEELEAGAAAGGGLALLCRLDGYGLNVKQVEDHSASAGEPAIKATFSLFSEAFCGDDAADELCNLVEDLVTQVVGAGKVPATIDQVEVLYDTRDYTEAEDD